jgi:hypothetical protein
MTASLTTLLLRQSEVAERPILTGNQAAPHFGRRFDRLLELGVLVELAPATEWDVCDSCECGMDARIIRETGGQLRALCLHDSGCDTILEPDDLRAFRIDPERLVGLIADASGFGEKPELLAPGLWRIGRLASGRFVVIGITARTLEQPGIVLLLKAATGGAPATVVAPDPGPAIRLRFMEAGIDLVDLSSSLRSAKGAVDGLDPDMLEPKNDGGEAGPELVVRKSSGAIEWRGTTIGFSHQQFPVLLRLLEKAVSRSPVASGPFLEGTTGREAKDLVRELRERVEGAGFAAADAKHLFKAVRGRGYVVGVPREEIVIID